jgi:hypothetical protein
MATNFEEHEIETEDEQDDEAVSIVYDIATYPSDFTLSGIAQMWKEEDIMIPDFQREFVWTTGTLYIVCGQGPASHCRRPHTSNHRF